MAGGDNRWRRIDREQVKHRFRDGDADLLLCTDAASEGLNCQFCGALVNYDMPWNPMRVEPRIGRIDRVGQQECHHPRREPALRRNSRNGRVPQASPTDRPVRASRRPPAAHSRPDAKGNHGGGALASRTGRRRECCRPSGATGNRRRSGQFRISTPRSTATSRYQRVPHRQ